MAAAAYQEEVHNEHRADNHQTDVVADREPRRSDALKHVHLVDPPFQADGLEDGDECEQAVVVRERAIRRVDLEVLARLPGVAVGVDGTDGGVVHPLARAILHASEVELTLEDGDAGNTKEEEEEAEEQCNIGKLCSTHTRAIR